MYFFFISGIFTVMCYNVLCDKYATRQMYGYCPSWALSWEYRKKVDNTLKTNPTISIVAILTLFLIGHFGRDSSLFGGHHKPSGN